MAFEYNNSYFNLNNREMCLTMQIVPGPIVEGLVDTTYEENKKMRCFINRTMSLVNIRETKKVKNSFLEAMYILKKKEYECRYPVVREEILIHVTGISNVEPIIRNNFDWRKTKRGRFGYGTSFSGDAEYANKYANNRIGPERAFIVTKVLISKTLSPKNLGIIIPPGNVDTTTGNQCKVYVKYCDHEVLPLFVIYFNTTSSDPRSHINQRSFTNQRPYSSQRNDVIQYSNTNQRPYSSQSNHISQRPSTNQSPYNNQNNIIRQRPNTNQPPYNNQNNDISQCPNTSQPPYNNQNNIIRQRPNTNQPPYNNQNNIIRQRSNTNQPPYNNQNNDISQHRNTSQRSDSNQSHTSQHSLSNNHSVRNQSTISRQQSRQTAETRNRNDHSCCIIL